MGRHKAPGRGRGERAARAERTAPRPLRMTEPQPGSRGGPPGPEVEHQHAAPAPAGQDHPEPPTPAGWTPGTGQGAPQSWAEDTWPVRTGAGQPTGPRPEDVEAFDSPHRATVSGPALPGPPRAGAPAAAPEPPPVPSPGPDGPPVRQAPPPIRRTTVPRILTGVLATAVLGVLAVNVSGQVSDRGEAPTGTSTDTRRDDSAASRSGRPDRDDDIRGDAKAGSRGSARPATLHQRLSVRLPLPDDLELDGRFEPVPGTAKAPGQGRKYVYRVDVEVGLPLDGKSFAALVQETLNDRRSWSHGGQMTFERVSSGPVDFVITLASPATTDAWCAKSGLDTSIDKVSCDSASTERVMINAYRWAKGATTFGDAMLGYRQMLINHEVGHRIGYGHASCSEDGALAPVMMQQTKYLTTEGATCKPNPWPHPES